MTVDRNLQNVGNVLVTWLHQRKLGDKTTVLCGIVYNA